MRRLIQIRTIVVVFLLLIDIYLFFVFKYLTQNSSPKLRLTVLSAHCIVSVASIVSLFVLNIVPQQTRYYIISIILGILIAKLLFVLVLLVDEIRRGIFWTVKRIVPSKPANTNVSNNSIPRSSFLVWLGAILGGGFLATFLYGFSNKYNYRVRTVKINFPNLPKSFKGLRILQLSDIHSGSFSNKRAVNDGVSMALREKPDIILFTGDLVNDRAVEMINYKNVFNRLTAPMGVYSTLGNHDYGDYAEWNSPEEKAANLEQLKNIHAEMGWRLLMNEHIIFERNGEKIALLGIENWGAKGHFPKYGKLDVAYKGTENVPFKILMSHDPSHWDAQVRPDYPGIDLTLAGHTHGMQFGVEIPHFKWSPIQYMYKQWAGLYKTGKQYLYVNRGYGFLGYPGRVGILPEITVIELV
ncbi:metallophosphatase [Arachidicoccus ginsenosidimutans]|uniref:metallophosphoesterase n=1 Tax=Arachidicoccus sp. BS20 TaxID=1850526 RepID=UPI0007F176BA|nr:metallophosphoesterase [Arachidicoccus sp. BS20]ANI89458.1 metallophosphatase [Arachidicoccus sp. BS20]